MWLNELEAIVLNTNASAVQQIDMPTTVEIAGSKSQTDVHINAGLQSANFNLSRLITGRRRTVLSDFLPN
jgi:hypothetical protein